MSWKKGLGFGNPLFFCAVDTTECQFFMRWPKKPWNITRRWKTGMIFGLLMVPYENVYTGSAVTIIKPSSSSVIWKEYAAVYIKFMFPRWFCSLCVVCLMYAHRLRCHLGFIAFKIQALLIQQLMLDLTFIPAQQQTKTPQMRLHILKVTFLFLFFGLIRTHRNRKAQHNRPKPEKSWQTQIKGYVFIVIFQVTQAAFTPL